ncbi:MAG TPA: hypothetical protein VNZ86_12980 [Bacteroidia bacterium]|jgi:hypothetical protein|nr:hypothetical protein [Bacteroidia bacterium]
MLISSFRSYTPASLLKVPVFGLFLWFFSGLYRHAPVDASVNQASPLILQIHTALSGLYFLDVFLSLACTIGSAFLLNYIVNQHSLLAKKTYLPAMLYLLYNACTGDFLRLHPGSITNLFIIATCHQLFNTYRKDSARAEVFNAGLLIGLASIIYLPSLVLFLFVWITLIIYRPFIWQEYVLSLLGFLMPWMFFLVYYFWNDQLQTIGVRLIFKHIDGHLFLFPVKPSYIWLYLVFGTVFLASFLAYTSSQLVMPLKSKKTFAMLVWCLITGIASAYLAPVISLTSLSIISIPMAVLSSNLFLQIKRGWLAELLFSFMLIAVLVVHLSVFLQK